MTNLGMTKGGYSRLIRSRVVMVSIVGGCLLLPGLDAMAAPVGAVCPAPGSGGTTHMVSSGQTMTDIQAAVDAAADGDVVCIAAGTYAINANSDRLIVDGKQITIAGQGGRAIFQSNIVFDYSANDPRTNTRARGIVEVLKDSADVTFQNLGFVGARLPNVGTGGAGVQVWSGNVTVINSLFEDNQNGLFTAGNGPTTGDGTDDVVIQNSLFRLNGGTEPGARGRTHAVYSSGAASLNVEDSYFTDTRVAHHIKSNAGTTTVSGVTIDDGLMNPSVDRASRSIELAMGNIGSVSDVAIIQRPDVPVPETISFAPENQGETDAANNNLSVDDALIVDFDASGVGVLNWASGLPASAVTFSNSTLIDVENPTQGPVATSGLTMLQYADLSEPSFLQDGIISVTGDGQWGKSDILGMDGADGSETGRITAGPGISGYSGVEIFDDSVYVVNPYFGIGLVDPLTGIATNFMGPMGFHSLGANDSQLFAGLFQQNTVYSCSSFTVGDAFDSTCSAIALDMGMVLGITGIDSDGTMLYAGSYNDGNVYVFDLDGNYVDMITTGLGGNELSALSYDVDSDSLLISTGYGNGALMRYAMDGTFLESLSVPGGELLFGLSGGGDFTSGGNNGNGGNGNEVDMPSSLAMMALALLPFALVNRRKLRSVQG